MLAAGGVGLNTLRQPLAATPGDVGRGGWPRVVDPGAPASQLLPHPAAQLLLPELQGPPLFHHPAGRRELRRQLCSKTFFQALETSLNLPKGSKKHLSKAFKAFLFLIALGRGLASWCSSAALGLD